MKVQELMSKPVVTCREDDTLNTAANMMWDHDCGAIPVVDDTGALVGIITDRDICMAAYTRGKRLAEIGVAAIMTDNVFSVSPEDIIQQAEAVMRQHQVRRVPVIDEHDHAIGMLTLSDIAREGDRELAQKSKQVSSDEVLDTIAAICEPRPPCIDRPA